MISVIGPRALPLPALLPGGPMAILSSERIGHTSVAVPLPSAAAVQELARERRAALWDVYQTAGRVSYLGVRIGMSKATGEVLQVGREPLSSLVARREAKQKSVAAGMAKAKGPEAAAKAAARAAARASKAAAAGAS